MNLLRQTMAICAMNFRNLGTRFWPSMVIVAGLGATIGVLLSMMSVTQGIRQVYINSGDRMRAIIVTATADGEGDSAITRDQAALITDAPGIAKGADGKPLADRGLNMGIPVLRKDGSKGYTTMRGYGPMAQQVRPEFHIIAGRMFRFGQREMVVGEGARFLFQNMNIGDDVILPGGPWKIVGIFKAGDITDGQVVGDTETMMPALHKTAYNSILVRLASYGSLDTLKRALTTNPALSVKVERHSDWYNRAAGNNSNFLAKLAYAIGAILAIGALFGCLNTMYSAVSSRGREIATLRALGFSAIPVMVSVILETLVLSIGGALIGAAAAFLLYNGKQDFFGTNVFHLTVSPGLVALGIIWAAVVALLGGLPPSIRAARRPVVDALRAT
ncbi:MAG: ABC transporter permease [Alphaproteobacteria bacterium]|nr:ABC transporter permease [Alphaproteobacteria bacterium]